MDLRQSTASQEILLGRFVDSTDGNTQETGLTINNTDIKLWKQGATTLANKNDGGATHIANGLYYAILDATDTNTLGMLEVHVHVTGALAIRREYNVLSQAAYDEKYSASAPSTLAAAAVLGVFAVTGTVNDGSATTTGFVGDSGLSSTDDFYTGSVLQFTSGALDGIARKVTGYTGATRTFAFADAFPAAPANADAFMILGRID